MTGDIQSSPRVSVILPTYNRARLIGRSIESVLQQSFADIELIVVDDGSTDATPEIIASIYDPRLRYIRLEKNGGVSAARNEGIRAARGEYLAFNDSDDCWLPGKLAAQVELMQKLASDFGLIISGVQRSEKNNLAALSAAAGAALPQISANQIVRNPENYAYVQGWLARRSVVLQSGLFDETMTLWEDWELLIRIALRRKIAPHPMLTAFSESLPDSIVIRNKAWADSYERIISKHREFLESDAEAYAAVLYGYGRQLLLKERYGAARQALVQALRRGPTNRRAWILLILACSRGARLLRWAVA